MNGPGAYDATLQMFVQQPRGIDLSRLRFLRWLSERGRLEHPPVGPSSGAYTRLDAAASRGRLPLPA
jgi:hypothetical protein